MKLSELTQDQQQKLTEFRAEMFAQATSTAPADRPRAEAAARRMAEIAGVNIQNVVWVPTPEAGAEAAKQAWASLSDSLSDSLWASLRASLSDSLWASLRASGWVAYWVAAVRITGHAGADVDRLEAYVALAQSAFAVWVMPGHVILCAKPTAAVVTDGRLVAVEWPTR